MPGENAEEIRHTNPPGRIRRQDFVVFGGILTKKPAGTFSGAGDCGNRGENQPGDERGESPCEALTCLTGPQHTVYALSGAFFLDLLAFVGVAGAFEAWAFIYVGAFSQGRLCWTIFFRIAVVSFADKGCTLGMPYLAR